MLVVRFFILPTYSANTMPFPKIHKPLPSMKLTQQGFPQKYKNAENYFRNYSILDKMIFFTQVFNKLVIKFSAIDTITKCFLCFARYIPPF